MFLIIAGVVLTAIGVVVGILQMGEATTCSRSRTRTKPPELLLDAPPGVPSPH